MKKRNLQLYTTVSSAWATATGIMGPFYVLLVEKISGGMEKLGFAFAIMILVNALSSYVTGYYSDKLGRKLFLFIIAYSQAIVIFLYTVISETYQLFILQALLGMIDGSSDTIKTSLLGDLTSKEKRGKSVGGFNATVNIASAAGLAIGGFIVKFYGLKSVFYITSVVIILSSSLFFFMKESDD